MIIPTNAEESGLIAGPTPIGENQENAIDMMAATANGVKAFENISAVLVSKLTCRFTSFP